MRENIFKIIRKLYTHAEKEVGKSDIDANFSGTTCVIVFQAGEKLITAKNDRIFKTIFVQEKDHHLMESILKECLGEEAKIDEYIKVELGVTNVSEKSKRLDAIFKLKGKKIIVELNTEGSAISKRNFGYFTKFYGTSIERGKSYKNDYVYILINLSYNIHDKNNYCRTYYIQDSEGKKYVNNFIVKEFNMDKITDECYGQIKNAREDEKTIIDCIKTKFGRDYFIKILSNSYY